MRDLSDCLQISGELLDPLGDWIMELFSRWGVSAASLKVDRPVLQSQFVELVARLAQSHLDRLSANDWNTIEERAAAADALRWQKSVERIVHPATDSLQVLNQLGRLLEGDGPESTRAFAKLREFALWITDEVRSSGDVFETKAEALLGSDDESTESSAGAFAKITAGCAALLVYLVGTSGPSGSTALGGAMSRAHSALDSLEKLQRSKRGGRSYSSRITSLSECCNVAEFEVLRRATDVLDERAIQDRLAGENVLLDGLCLAAASKRWALTDSPRREPGSFALPVRGVGVSGEVGNFSRYLLSCAADDRTSGVSQHAMAAIDRARSEQDTASSSRGRGRLDWTNSPSVRYYGSSYGRVAALSIQEALGELIDLSSIPVRFWLRRLPHEDDKQNQGKIEHALYFLSDDPRIEPWLDIANR